ncbi:DUF3391 domain-containing protein [Pseudodesulfovibrio sp. JC047]|uniref:HD-GYP domain-containing protein n=1 Tax=Pseudodesulfovibrio sp. JC047 TaxID=2683199 RepID=UPI0013D7EEF4|nr:HD-GYP domain-containing protein [Pseudodesulfovibrio sp. JC047]NDV18570.1 DUF3391 domain-containing protein [Pseudodesulfovibrio sp. JC047]
MTEYRIPVEHLRPGVFIRLEKTSWFDHPFLFSNFKIKDQKHVQLIQRLGISHVLCIPEKSDVLPLNAPEQEPASLPVEEQISQDIIDHLWAIKNERTLRLRQKKERIARCEKHFSTCISHFNAIERNLLSGTDQSLEEALNFVQRLTDLFLKDRESTLHLMHVTAKEEATYSHPMNVAILSMMVGKEARLTESDMTTLGLGALLHDIGKNRIPKKLLKKRGERTRPEQEILRQHPVFGVEMLSEVDALSSRVATIVGHHHEQMDGSGYPKGLDGSAIDPLARIVTIADAYDNHCNHADPMDSMTPYLALSHMFGHQKHLFDVEDLTLFIRCLGIYPPGTVVELSNGDIGMVMAVNPKSQLNPSVMLYDPDVPKKEALIVDLVDEQDLKVEKSIRLTQLPQEAHDYLSPRAKFTYYVDPTQ